MGQPDPVLWATTIPPLPPDDETTWLTYREAAKVVRRRPRTIRYWRLRGMPMDWDIRDGQHVRIVRADILKAWWRARLKNDPIHQQKMRMQHAEPSLSGWCETSHGCGVAIERAGNGSP